MSSLLPPNATPFELATEASTERIGDVPVPVGDLWNPQTCPIEALPWLAWALSVDDWDSSWPEKTKRAVVAASMAIHRIKGTVGAVRRALASAGVGEVQIEEWWQFGGDPYTARLTLTPEAGNVDVWDAAERAAKGAANVRTHFEVKVRSCLASQIKLAAAIQSSECICIEPWAITELSTTGALYYGGAIQHTDIVSIYPASWSPEAATVLDGLATLYVAAALLQRETVDVYPLQ